MDSRINSKNIEGQEAAAEAASGSYGYVHSVESGGTVDGPGVRFVVFTSGCPLRCQYCHNPDAMIKKDGKRRSATDVIEEVGTYASFIQQAGGGLTVTGGEPLLQADFVRSIFAGVKESYNMHTTLDTSGHGNLEKAKALLEVTDLVMLDIKSWNPQIYQRLTGRSIDPCLEFASYLASINKPTWIRFVLVPGVTDDPDNVAGLAQFLKGLQMVERIELLPFHKMGEYKWEELGMDYHLKDVEPPTPQQLASVREILKTSGHKVVG